MMAVIVMSLEQAEALQEFLARKMKPNGSPLSPVVIEAAAKFARDLRSAKRGEAFADRLEEEHG